LHRCEIVRRGVLVTGDVGGYSGRVAVRGQHRIGAEQKTGAHLYLNHTF
jgi:hypothetical protein